MITCSNCGHVLAPRTKPLTKRQSEILDFIRGWIEVKGFAPTQQEIATAFGFTSLSTVHEHLVHLEKAGRITRTYQEARSITLISEEDVHA